MQFASPLVAQRNHIGLAIRAFVQQEFHRWYICIGKSPQEALSEVLIAKELWLEVAKEKGYPIPEPRYRPVIYQAKAS